MKKKILYLSVLIVATCLFAVVLYISPLKKYSNVFKVKYENSFLMKKWGFHRYDNHPRTRYVNGSTWFKKSGDTTLYISKIENRFFKDIHIVNMDSSSFANFQKELNGTSTSSTGFTFSLYGFNYIASYSSRGSDILIYTDWINR